MCRVSIGMTQHASACCILRGNALLRHVMTDTNSTLTLAGAFQIQAGFLQAPLVKLSRVHLFTILTNSAANAATQSAIHPDLVLTEAIGTRKHANVFAKARHHVMLTSSLILKHANVFAHKPRGASPVTSLTNSFAIAFPTIIRNVHQVSSTTKLFVAASARRTLNVGQTSFGTRIFASVSAHELRFVDGASCGATWNVSAYVPLRRIVGKISFLTRKLATAFVIQNILTRIVRLVSYLTKKSAIVSMEFDRLAPTASFTAKSVATAFALHNRIASTDSFGMKIFASVFVPSSIAILVITMRSSVTVPTECRQYQS